MMKNKFKYKGFQVERRYDHELGDYFYANRRGQILESPYVLDPTEENLQKAFDYLAHLIHQYWYYCKKTKDWRAFAPEFNTPQQIEDFLDNLANKLDMKYDDRLK